MEGGGGNDGGDNGQRGEKSAESVEEVKVNIVAQKNKKIESRQPKYLYLLTSTLTQPFLLKLIMYRPQ